MLSGIDMVTVCAASVGLLAITLLFHLIVSVFPGMHERPVLSHSVALLFGLLMLPGVNQGKPTAVLVGLFLSLLVSLFCLRDVYFGSRKQTT
jgi:hypothetical protein